MESEDWPGRLLLSYVTLVYPVFHPHDRTHDVKIGWEPSDWLTINIGLPHGSLSGPILILIFINGLVILPSKLKPFLYDDSTTLLFSDYYDQNLILEFNSGLTLFKSWSSSKNSSKNEGKTYSMTVNLYSPQRYSQIRLKSRIHEFKNQC